MTEDFPMKNLLMVALCAGMLGSLSGCAMATGGSNSVTGFIYSGYRSSGVVGTGTGNKTGQACASSILGWIAVGDASITAAAEEGKITQIHHVDHDQMDILGLYATSCTTVVGQ
jgi:hypothetical protein